MVLRRALEKLGHKVTIARDGSEAWDLYFENPFRIVISDWMMPNVDGIELCRRIRSLQDNNYTYLVLITAKTSKEDRLLAMELGADDFLTKPLDVPELTARLVVARRLLDAQDTALAQAQQLSRMVEVVDASKKRFSELFMGLPIPCVSFDADGILREANHAAEQLYAFSPESMHSDLVWDRMCDASDAARFREFALNIVKNHDHTKGPAHPCDASTIEWVRTKDENLQFLLGTAFPLRAGDGSIVGGVCAVIDLTRERTLEKHMIHQIKMTNELNEQLASANFELERLATTDALTGLRNRRYFVDCLNKATCERSSELALMMIDVDHFKAFNDQFGHVEGDTVLRQVGQILSANCPEGSVAARYGGEEFVVLLRNVDLSGAKYVSETLRRAIEQNSWPHRPITISIGIAMLGEHATNSNSLIVAADEALYRSKTLGRNRISISECLEKAA